MSRLLRYRRIAQAAALLALAVLAPACGGGGGGGVAVPVYGISTTSLASGTVGTAYSQTLSVVAGTAPFTWSVLSGSLPGGLTLAPATGVISGTPTGPNSGSFSFTMRVVDANAAVDDQVLSILIMGAPAALTVSTTTLTDATQDSPYSVGLSASGGTPPYTWAVTTGTLPAGLTLNASTGVISGTPTAAGAAVNFTVTVSDAATSDAQALSITVNAPLVITSASPLPEGSEGAAYTLPLTQTGGSGGVLWSLFSGIIPPGLSIAPATGVLSGTPTAPGTYGFRVRIIDNASAEALKVFSLTINPAPVVTTIALVPWTVNHAGYSQTLTASGGTGASTWSITAGALPGGLTLAPATGAITGMPAAAGTFNFTVTATDTAGGTGSKGLSILVNDAVTVSPLTLPGWTINRTGYSQTVTSADGTGARTLSRTGTIPTGMTFTLATGVLSGTPTAAGTFNFTVTATDTVGATGSQAYAVVINPAPVITTTTAPAWTQNFGYTPLPVASTGGTTPFAWTSTGSLPTGITLDGGTGVLSGTPTAAGTFNFTVTLTDTTGAVTSQALSIVINAEMAIPTATPLLPWTRNLAGYSQSVTATGGTGAQTWDISAGALPTGLGISAGGAITGTPSAANTFNFTVRVTDSVGATQTKAMSILINDVLTVTTATPMAEHTKDRLGYNQSVAATGGTGAQTWDISAGALPDNLAISAGGAITGTPTANGTFNFTVRVTDSLGATGTKAMSIVINDVLVVTTATPMAAWTEDFAGYNQSVAATGGTGAKTWDISAGALPDSLSISAGGAITGTPSVAGTFNFTVRVTDAVGATGTKAMSIVINAALEITTASPLPDGTQGVSYGPLTFVATGGTGALSFSSGAVPAGMSGVTSAGVLSGIPTGSGLTTFQVTVTDLLGATGSKNFDLTIAASPLTITTAALPDAIVGSGYRVMVQVVGGTATYTWSISAGGLPAPLALDTATGVISGIPGAPGPVDVTIQVQDSSGPVQTVSKQFQFNVKGPTPGQGSLSINTLRLPDAALAPYNQAIGATGGTSPYNFTLDPTGNPLPAGLSLAINGTVSGTPSAGQEGQYTISVIATDSAVTPAVARANVLLVVGDPPTALSISTNAIPDGASGTAYPTTRLVAVGGQPPYYWDIAEDSDGPQGMVLASTGIFYGVPRQYGSFRTVFRVRDSSSPQRIVTKAIMYTIADPGTGFRITNPDPINGTDGTPYNHAFTATGAVKSWVTDDRDLSFVGLSLDPATGVLSGTPTASGLIEFIIGAVADGAAPRATTLAISRLTIQPQPFGITTNSLPDIEPGATYDSGALGVQGGTAPFTWSIDAASPSMQDHPGTGLPTGFTINSATGAIGGMTTSSSGSGLELLIRVTDSTAAFRLAYIKISYVRNVMRLSFQPAGPGVSQSHVMAMATEGSGYLSGQLPLSNGNQDLTEAAMLPGSSVPTGLTLDPARRTFTGTPAVPGRYVLPLRLTDRWFGTGGVQEVVENSEDRTILEIHQAAGFRVATRNLPSAREGTAYVAAVEPEEGTVNPYAFSVSSGSLPPGLILDAVNGIISGTPTVAGTYSFEISVVQSGNTRRMAYQLPVDPKLVLAILTDRLPQGPIGASYNGTLSGRAPGAITWSDTGSATTFASLGLSLDGATGVITGTPTAAQGFYQIRVSAVSGLESASRMVGILIEPLPITSVGFRGIGFVGLDALMPGIAFGGTGPYVFTLGPGEELAPGTSMDAAGTISGIPTMQTNFSSVLVKIQDGTGRIGYGRLEAIIIGADLPALSFGPAFGEEVHGRAGQVVPTGQHTFQAQGGTPNYTYSVFSPLSRPNDMIPPGMTINTINSPPGTADFVGTFAATGEYTFVLRATDGAAPTPATVDMIARVRVEHQFFPTDPNIETLRVPDGSSATPYPATQLRGFSPNAGAWTFEGGVGPAGLSLSASGVISSAAPLAAGTHYFLVRHTDTVTTTFSVGRIKLVID